MSTESSPERLTPNSSVADSSLGPRPTVSIVVLVGSGVEAVGRLLERAKEALEDSAAVCEILLVDAGSDEKTATQASAEGISVLSQDGRDYVSALRAGMSASSGDLIVTLDGSHSHDLSIIRDLLSKSGQAEMVIASRYVRTGNAQVSLLRRLLSRLGNRVFSAVLDVPLTDLTSGFRLYHRRALEQIELGRGDSALLEITVRFYMAGFRIAEVPFQYHPARSYSEPNSLVRLAWSFARAMLRLRRLRNSIASADYDHRAFHSRHPVQRYWQRRRYAIVRGFVERYQQGVDVGCGSSVILDSLPGVIGVDINRAKLRFLGGRAAARLVCADIRELPFADQAFDLCICSQVIEHLPDDPRILAELRRLLKPGGVLILGTPDYDKRAWRMIEWLYKRAAPGGYGDEHITHYTFAGLRQSLARHGFDILDHRYICDGELILKARRTA